MNKLVAQTLSTFLIGAVALGVLLFLPAWTLNYWQAWVFIVVFMTSVIVIGLYLSLKDPALLERRKKFGRRRKPWKNSSAGADADLRSEAHPNGG